MGISGQLYNLLKSYFSTRIQRVVLNGQTSSWIPVLAGALQILGPLLFLIYINELPNELKSTLKLFADDASLFTFVKDKNESANTLHNDLMLISKCFLIQIPVTLPKKYYFLGNNKSKFIQL